MSTTGAPDAGTPAKSADPPTPKAPRSAPPSSPAIPPALALWEKRSRPFIIAAAIAPLVDISSARAHSDLVSLTIAIISWLVFVVDLFVHLHYRRDYLRTGGGIFDLSIVVLTSPWYLIPGVGGAEIVALLRLARLARVAMIGFNTPMIRRTLDRLGRPMIYVVFSVLISALIVLRAEDGRNGFKDYGDSLWWAVVTITTVGYGNLVPGTEVGQITATILMFIGIALLGTVAASLASLFRMEDRAEEGGDGVGGPIEDVVDKVESMVHEELRALREEVSSLREELRSRER